ncbi:DUF4157 domain-containing protein [Spirosoma sp.]|uniref:eCIS core domain-containing protein n=1 Tax=Spirosoma sp. TaxID=1899569 RepID=UPI002639C49D|nr:DUF4157 domain-containing protein [Spirosoma sp.]MCX6218602.1 DUF4157 domain-containing protein [Spirosoma sp.]
MKASSDKSTTTTPSPATQTSSQPFFAKAGGGDFSEPTRQTPAPAVQMKLTVNKPGDSFEQEADKTADKVMRMPAPMSAPAITGKDEKLQRQTDDKLQKKEDDKLQKAALPEEKIQKAELKDDKIQKAPAQEEKLQKKESTQAGKTTGDGTPAVTSDTQSAIQSQTSGGQPLSNDVRTFMEPRFGADFSNVRIHTNAESAGLSNHLSARAFTYQNHIFFSRDQYQPGTSEGKQLLAHELTHTVQQGHAVQRSPQVATTATPPPVQRLGMQDALDYFADKAYNIPGFRMLTIVLGFNPINRQSTDRSAANILRALIELVPGGHLITQALDNHGVFAKAGAWIEQKLATLGDIGSEIISGLRSFINSLSWSDIFDLGGVWERAKRIFTDPIGRLISFAGSVVSEILKMVKDAILKPLAALAEGTRGYDLLKALLGVDPITGEAVPRTADTLIGGFMKLIGQEEIWENIKKGNAVARAWAWFQGALGGLLNFARTIPRRIIDTLTSLTFQDILSVAGAFTKIVGSFASIAGEFFSWALNQVISLLEILFSVVAPGVMPYIAKARAAFQTILKNPIGFVNNLVRAGKMGFQLFASNIGKHLKTALIKWITGPLGEAGVYIPQSFNLIEIVKLVLSVLGLTWQNIRSKLVKIIPEPVLVVLEKTAGVLVTLVKDGPAAAWEQIKTELTELKDQMISQVTQMITTEVVKAAVAKLVSMINPAGAVIQAILAIYNTVTFFIQKINQIAAVVASFIDSISAIASGQVEGAAKKVEDTMASTLTVIIAFLAKFAGLGNIPEKLVGIVKKIRQPIDKGLDKIVAWLGNMLKKLGGALSSFFSPQSFKVEDEDHKLYPDNSGEPMVASSNPKRLEAALKELGADPGLAKDLGKANKKLKDATNPTQKAAAEKEVNGLVSKAVALLVQLKYGKGTKETMEKTSVSFTPPAKSNPTSIAEFKRQIGMQHQELNKTEVGKWQQNRARFIGFGRDKKSDTKETRSESVIDLLKVEGDKAIAELQNLKIISARDAQRLKTAITVKNEKQMKNIVSRIMGLYSSNKLAVLHTVDQVAGGSADIYGDEKSIFGQSDINSSIGSQWAQKIDVVDKAAKNVKPTALVNVDLTPR